jgi:hypothetical protein
MSFGTARGQPGVISPLLKRIKGRAIAQAVRCWLWFDCGATSNNILSGKRFIFYFLRGFPLANHHSTIAAYSCTIASGS